MAAIMERYLKDTSGSSLSALQISRMRPGLTTTVVSPRYSMTSTTSDGNCFLRRLAALCIRPPPSGPEAYPGIVGSGRDPSGFFRGVSECHRGALPAGAGSQEYRRPRG